MDMIKDVQHVIILCFTLGKDPKWNLHSYKNKIVIVVLLQFITG